MNFFSKFFQGMLLDYAEAWENTPAVVLWTAVISFILGAVFL